MSNELIIGITVLIFFLALAVIISYYANKVSSNTVDDYFLAGRSLGIVVLAFTQMATILSGLVFVGGPGIVYATGAGFFSGLTMGTCLAALMFYVVGRRLWEIGNKYRFITPGEFFRDRFESPGTQIVMLIAMLAFVIPYIALQPIAGGMALSGLTKGAIPYAVGSLIIVVTIIVYVYFGGLRAVAWTDVIQGSAMLIFLWVLVFVAAGQLGGMSAASEAVKATMPDIFERTGPVGAWGWKAAFSWMCITFFSISCQPPVFIRFFAAQNMKAIKWLFVLWPLLIVACWAPTVFIGAYGKILYPDLAVPDEISATLIIDYAPLWLAILIFVGLLSAIKSTADSQFHVLSSMLTRDFYVPFVNQKASTEKQLKVGKWFIVLLGIVGYLVAFRPPELIGFFANSAFTGIAVLCVPTLAALYWKRATAAGVIWSVILGETLALGSFAGIFPNSWWMGFDVVIPALIITTAVIVVVSYFTKLPSEETINKYFSNAA